MIGVNMCLYYYKLDYYTIDELRLEAIRAAKATYSDNPSEEEIESCFDWLMREGGE